MLKQRIKNFIESTGVSITGFAKKVGLSTGSIHRYFRDDLRLSAETEQRISEYLKQFNF